MLLSASYIDGSGRGIWGEHPSKSGGTVTGEVSAERFISCGGSTDRRLACICDSLRVSITGSQRLDSNDQAGGLFLIAMLIDATRSAGKSVGGLGGGCRLLERGRAVGESGVAAVEG